MRDQVYPVHEYALRSHAVFLKVWDSDYRYNELRSILYSKRDILKRGSYPRRDYSNGAGRTVSGTRHWGPKLIMQAPAAKGRMTASLDTPER